MDITDSLAKLVSLDDDDDDDGGGGEDDGDGGTNNQNRPYSTTAASQKGSTAVEGQEECTHVGLDNFSSMKSGVSGDHHGRTLQEVAPPPLFSTTADTFGLNNILSEPQQAYFPYQTQEQAPQYLYDGEHGRLEVPTTAGHQENTHAHDHLLSLWSNNNDDDTYDHLQFYPHVSRGRVHLEEEEEQGGQDEKREETQEKGMNDATASMYHAYSEEFRPSNTNSNPSMFDNSADFSYSRSMRTHEMHSQPPPKNNIWQKRPPKSVLEAKAVVASSAQSHVQWPTNQMGRIPQKHSKIISSKASGRVCKYFLQGRCKFGDSCMFLHEERALVDVQEIVDFLRNIPKSVTRVPYRIATAQIDPETGNPIKRKAFTNNEGDMCDQSQGSGNESVTNERTESVLSEGELEESLELDDNMEELPNSLKRWSVADQFPTAPEESVVEAERIISAEAECGVCYDYPREEGRSFGILPGCEHVFCLECIRQWRGRIDRSKENVRSCPLCRRESFFVVPLERVVYDPFRKVFVLEEYKRRLKEIPCKHFEYGKGSCPFNGSCFYLHMYPDGTLEKPSKPRLISNAEGSITPMKGIRLSDFLNM